MSGDRCDYVSRFRGRVDRGGDAPAFFFPDASSGHRARDELFGGTSTGYDPVHQQLLRPWQNAPWQTTNLSLQALYSRSKVSPSPTIPSRERIRVITVHFDPRPLAAGRRPNAP